MAMTDTVLQSLAALFQKDTSLVGRISWDAWKGETSTRAAQVELHRQYLDGEHRAKLTEEMKHLLRLDGTGATEDVSPFNVNHCANIVQKLVDRLDVTGIEADTDAGTMWIKDVMDFNRFDGLQLTVHDAACGDGDGYLLVGYDETNDLPIMTQEDAYDGVEGMILVYGVDGRTPAVAIKIWREIISAENKLSDRARVNVYYPDRVEKYVTSNGGALQQYRDNEGDTWPYKWVDGAGQPLGVPVIPFHNGRGNYGRSEIADALPVQDALNRVMTSMIMAAELTAFQIRLAVGFTPPAGLAPGTWVTVNPGATAGSAGRQAVDPAITDYLKSVRAEVMETADLSPYLEVQRFMIDQMYEITRTPRAASADSSASGESLKQREIDLVGKAKRAQIGFGRAWEEAIAFAAKLQNFYGRKKAPAFVRATVQWKSAELRDTAKEVANAMAIKDVVDKYTLLETLAPMFNWSTEKLLEIQDALKDEQTSRLSALGVGGALPGFGGAQPLDAGAGQADGANDNLAANIVSVPVSANGVTAAAA